MDGSVAVEAHDDVAGAFAFLGPGLAGCERDPAADDGVGSDTARLRMTQMHRAAAAFAVAFGQSHDLGKCPAQRVVNGHWHGVGQWVPTRLVDEPQELAEKLRVAAVRAAHLV